MKPPTSSKNDCLGCNTLPSDNPFHTHKNDWEERLREEWNEYAGRIAFEDDILSFGKAANWWLKKLSLHEKELREKYTALIEWAEHNKSCILSYWRAGEPTPDGGYRNNFKGKWYQSRPIDETPKCDCGLDDILKLFGEGV